MKLFGWINCILETITKQTIDFEREKPFKIEIDKLLLPRHGHVMRKSRWFRAYLGVLLEGPKALSDN